MHDVIGKMLAKVNIYEHILPIFLIILYWKNNKKEE